MQLKKTEMGSKTQLLIGKVLRQKYRKNYKRSRLLLLNKCKHDKALGIN